MANRVPPLLPQRGNWTRLLRKAATACFHHRHKILGITKIRSNPGRWRKQQQQQGHRQTRRRSSMEDS